jgi:hypothetical protein
MFSLSQIFKRPPSILSFEEIQGAIKKPGEYTMIHTMIMDSDENREHGLIKGTTPTHREEELINGWISNYEFYTHKIIVYGANSRDMTVDKKVDQLSGIGFSQLYIYRGGMFEWVLLQDIYGAELFPTTSNIRDILIYK